MGDGITTTETCVRRVHCTIRAVVGLAKGEDLAALILLGYSPFGGHSVFLECGYGDVSTKWREAAADDG